MEEEIKFYSLDEDSDYWVGYHEGVYDTLQEFLHAVDIYEGFEAKLVHGAIEFTRIKNNTTMVFYDAEKFFSLLIKTPVFRLDRLFDDTDNT